MKNSALDKATSSHMAFQDPAAQPPEPMSVVVTFIYLVEFGSILASPNLTEQAAEVLSTFVDVCVKYACSNEFCVCFSSFYLSNPRLLLPISRIATIIYTNNTESHHLVFFVFQSLQSPD